MNASILCSGSLEVLRVYSNTIGLFRSPTLATHLQRVPNSCQFILVGEISGKNGDLMKGSLLKGH